VPHVEESDNEPGRFSTPEVIDARTRGGDNSNMVDDDLILDPVTGLPPEVREGGTDQQKMEHMESGGDAAALGAEVTAPANLPAADEEEGDKIEGYETDDEDGEGREGVFFQNAARAADINPIWTRRGRPFTEIFNEHLNDFPHFMREIQGGRINFGRKFWRGLNLDVFDMDRISRIVVGEKLSLIKDMPSKVLAREQVAAFVECLANVQIITGESVVCATDGCVSDYSEVVGDFVHREKRAGAAAVVWYQDSVSPVATSHVAVLGSCGADPDSFDVESVAASLAPEAILDGIPLHELEKIKSIIIVTDSNSLLSALLNYTDDSSDVLYPVVRELERLEEAIGSGIPIKMYWCPGHQRNFHNDAADHLAGRAIQWGPIGSKPSRFAVKSITPSIMRRELYKATRMLRPPHSNPPSPYMQRRFSLLGAFRPPRGTFPATGQEFVYLSLWLGYTRTGLMGMGDIFYERESKQPYYTCSLCGKKAECLDHFLFQCEGCPEASLVDDEGDEEKKVSLKDIRERIGLPHMKILRSREVAEVLKGEPRRVLAFVQAAAEAEWKDSLLPQFTREALAVLPAESAMLMKKEIKIEKQPSTITKELLSGPLKILDSA